MREREREGGNFETDGGSWRSSLRSRNFAKLSRMEIGRLKYVCADFRARCFATNATKCRAKEWIDINCKQCPIHHVKSIQRIVRSNIESNKRLPQLYQIIADLHIAFGVHVTIIHVIRCHPQACYIRMIITNMKFSSRVDTGLHGTVGDRVRHL